MGNYEEKSKRRDRQHGREDKASAFRCGHCHAIVIINPYIGTKNRNHCNFCLWSKHVDTEKGDRQSHCLGGMEPIGLTFKQEGYGKVGELMLIHMCMRCQKISINRLAADDDEEVVERIFYQSWNLHSTIKTELANSDVYLLSKKDVEEVIVQLRGT